MKRLMAWLLGVPTLLALLLFALANRRLVQVSLDPLLPEQPLLALRMPLWMLFFAGILVGLLAGGVATWLRQSKWRRLARRCQQELERERLRRRQLERAAASAPSTVEDARSAASGERPLLTRG